MKFIDIHPTPVDIHISECNIAPCVICKEDTRTIDIDYQAWLCSEECRIKFEEKLHDNQG